MTLRTGFCPDVVYRGGTVITMDEAHPTAEALATHGDRIVAVGPAADVLALAGTSTRVVDLAGRTMLPGFIEPHNHFSLYGPWALLQANLNSPPVGRIRDMADVIDALGERAGSTPKDGWVLGFGYDDTLLAEGRHPTRQDLDRVSKDHPVWITHVSGHVGVANSVALQLAGIGKGTADPEGGVIRRQVGSSEPDGVLEEMPAMGMVVLRLPRLTVEQRIPALATAAGHYLKAGVTSCCDAAVGFMGREDVVAYQRAIAEGTLPLRITMMANPELMVGPRGENAAFLTGFGNARLKIGPIKIIGDGSIQAYTGWLSKPYHVPFKGNELYRGYPVTPPEKLNELVTTAHGAGFQVAIHANGDAAIDAAIDAYRRAQEAHPRPDSRHRIEHCQMAREDQLDAVAELGVSPSFFASHTFYWGDRHKAIFMGPERAARMSPLKSALRRGIKFSIHSDCPVTPVSPLFCVFAAVNRVTSTGEVLGAEYRLTPAEALRAVTIDAAWQDFEEKRKGSIEVGKLADFTLLAENPLKVAPGRIKDIRVEEVIIGGESVFKAE